MKFLRNQRSTLLLVIFAVVVAFALPASAFAQGRGRGWGQEKKAEKFINGHDARDGRWDGRGPRINRRVFRNDGFFIRRAHRVRHQRFNRDVDRDNFGRFNRVNRFERQNWRSSAARRNQWRSRR